MSTKTDSIDWATRPGVKSIVADCLGSRCSRTKSLATQSCQLINGIKLLQRSDCSGILKLGNVQCNRCECKPIPMIHSKKALHNREMNCPNCESTHASKNGHRRGKQNYICRDCGRQFVESYSPKGYADEIKERCLSMYVNGNGFRAIERLTGVNHNKVINWVKKAAIPLADAPDYSEIPEIAQIDELPTFVGKKNKIWL